MEVYIYIYISACVYTCVRLSNHMYTRVVCTCRSLIKHTYTVKHTELERCRNIFANLYECIHFYKQYQMHTHIQSHTITHTHSQSHRVHTNQNTVHTHSQTITQTRSTHTQGHILCEITKPPRTVQANPGRCSANVNANGYAP